MFSSHRTRNTFPRLPLEGYLDLTYRCNNVCSHCWLWKASNAEEQARELTFAEIRRIIDDARELGTQRWGISGGEPMLRSDFVDIFNYITHKSVGYSLNSNGTLITPEIARLMKHKGTKMIALYGATADVYDHITHHSGGFDAALRGMNYLREAGAGFIVQLIPMRENWHQWQAMQILAKSLSPYQRIGASWLYMSAGGIPVRNQTIAGQRLTPADVIELDPPKTSDYERSGERLVHSCGSTLEGEDGLFANCIAVRREFHIDAYGGMSWCEFIKDPSLRYDLRNGTFREAWEEFIPSCADKVHGGDEWRTNCRICEIRTDCRWCAAYSYLETGRYSAPIPYLCEVAAEARKYKIDWTARHRKFFQIADITVQVECDLNFDEIKFFQEFAPFAVEGPGDDNVTLRHYFELPDWQDKNLGKELYFKAPWSISRNAETGAWYYRGIMPASSDKKLHRFAVFSSDHRHGRIFSPPGAVDGIRADGWYSLSLFPTDQIWLAPLLAERNAVLIHSAAAIIKGQGLIFVGRSESGKSTTMELLRQGNGLQKMGGEAVEILCDDRNIIRKWVSPNTIGYQGWRVYGTWSHGSIPDVSGASAPLRAIIFLQQDTYNEIEPLTDHKEIWVRLLATLIRSMVTAEWWQKELNVLEQIVEEVECYLMHFDMSGAIVTEINRLVT